MKQAEQTALHSMIEEATGAFKNAIEQVIEKSKSATSDVVEKAEDVIEGSEDFLNHKLNQSKKMVKKHPVESVVIGFGVGCLVGLCISRLK